MRHVKELLEAWGNWSGSRVGTEYKGAWPAGKQATDDRPCLNDEEGLIIDQAVASLKFFDSTAYKIIVAYYRGRLSCRMMGQVIKRHHSYVSAYLERAEAYIAGRIHQLLQVA